MHTGEHLADNQMKFIILCFVSFVAAQGWQCTINGFFVKRTTTLWCSSVNQQECFTFKVCPQDIPFMPWIKCSADKRCSKAAKHLLWEGELSQGWPVAHAIHVDDWKVHASSLKPRFNVHSDWHCVDNVPFPVKIVGGHAACLSLDSKSCWWGESDLFAHSSKSECHKKQKLAVLDEYQHFSCGPKHAMYWGDDGYHKNSWCTLSKQSLSTDTLPIRDEL